MNLVTQQCLTNLRGLNIIYEYKQEDIVTAWKVDDARDP